MTSQESRRQEQAIENLSTRKLSPLEQVALHDLDLSQQMAYNVLNKYGLTVKQYARLLEDQNGRCRICQTGIRGRYTTPRGGIRLRACVDHDHGSGLIRGLLCHKCNVGIGLFGESIRNLASAIVYLEDHGKTF